MIEIHLKVSWSVFDDIMDKSKHISLAKKMKFKNFYRIEYFGLNLLGIDLSAEQKILKRLWFMVLSGTSAFIMMAAAFFYTVTHLDKLDVAVLAFAQLVQMLNIFWKFAFVILRRKAMQRLLLNIWQVMDRG